ncbi:MAG: hypothetical protein IH613_10290 [Desulfuromonadales bacterium]|nr:hypothetical protein [Desulfuromonadales bacterium]
MRIVMLTWIGIFCLATWSIAAQEPGARYAGQLDWTRDLIVKRVVVPSADQPEGEVQLIRRGDLLVVRTLLSSRILKRVVAAIDSRENRSWPETREGHIDSLRYREELFRATEKSWEAFRQRSDRNRDRQTLAIEFILGPNQSLIALSLPQLSEKGGNLCLIDKRSLKVWRGSEDYVRANILEIIKDSFHLDDAAIAELLKPLWPSHKKALRD